MPPRTTRRMRRIGASAALAGALLGLAAPGAGAAYNPADPAQKSAYDAALPIAESAYEYGIPLVNMQKTFETATSVNVSNGRGLGPVNQFNHFAKLADAADRTVVAPNSDTLYSNAWLDLSRRPQVIHTSASKRFHVLPLMSPYEENFKSIGSPDGALPDGDYLVTGPGFKGSVPKGLKRIRSPYNRVWIIGRTYNAGKSDLAATKKLMNTFRITPLNRWNPKKPYAYRPAAPGRKDTRVNEAHIPGTGPGEDAATFFDALGDQLKAFPAPRADAPILARLKGLGIGAGLHPATDGKLSDAQLQALRDAVTGGPAKVQGNLISAFLSGFDTHNGWLVMKTGTYGTDYRLRAVVDKAGLGAPTPNVAMYPLSIVDRTKSPLTGTKRYVVHFPANMAKPPVKFFWSLTLYDNDGFFIVNPANKWLVNDRSDLKRNADGSIDVYIQPDAPSSAAQRVNWLPSPKATAATPGFRLITRLYGLSPKGIQGVLSGRGWQAPSILPCGADGRTGTGIACAG